MRRRLVLVTLILASLTAEPARSQSTVPAADSQIAPASSDDREAPPAAAARPDEYLHLDLSPTEQADAISQLNELRGAVRVTPDSAEDRLRLAQALYRFGDLDAALDECRVALEPDRNNARAHWQLSVILMTKQDWRSAATALTEATLLDPGLTQAHYSLGSVQYSLGNLSASIQSYRRALELQPHFPDARYRLALVLTLANKHREAAQFMEEAAAVREALALRETRAEALREDLAAARTAVAQSTDQQEQLARAIESLRAELVEAQTQEEAARKQLAELEQQLHSLKAATTEPMPIGNVELDRLRDECRQLGLITRDTNLLRLYRDLKKGAKSALTVLLLGEPGTGKELFARAVHRLSPRGGKTFVAVNMAAISPELFESELFGHKKGSFTGATADRRGYFELANQGTIFLDEIGDLRLDHQSKLLRVLQDKSIYRVGATTPTTVDVRIVAATNRDLQRGVSEGWFREDLYFRLTGLVFRLPPLRERPDDIPLLTDAFLGDIAAQMGKPVPQLSHEALRASVKQEWKGNVRELRHCLEQAVTLNDGPILSKDSLRLIVDNAKLSGRAKHLLPAPAGDEAVLNCLRQHGFDMQATAKTLGWDRSTITQRLKGLCFQSLVESDGDQAKAALTIAGDPSRLRTVELKLMDYYSHLLSVIEPFATADEALADCKRRFKNLPDRHFAAVERLVRKHFEA